MRNPDYSTVDPKTGSVNYNGPSEIMPGTHSHMPPRTDAFLQSDERGHVQASSLGGINTTSNIVPENAEVNHKAQNSMEQGERCALQNGAAIHSDKTAYASNQPGARPDAFIVNDTVSYPDGHTETIHLSYANESYKDQEARNEQSATLKDTFDAPNPGDNLRASMSNDEYSILMQETDESLPNLRDEYAPADFSGIPSTEAWDADISTDPGSTAVAGEGASPDSEATEASVDSSADDGGASPDPD